MQTVWYWHKDTHIAERNRIESSEINPYICSQVISDHSRWGEGYLMEKRQEAF